MPEENTHWHIQRNLNRLFCKGLLIMWKSAAWMNWKLEIVFYQHWRKEQNKTWGLESPSSEVSEGTYHGSSEGTRVYWTSLQNIGCHKFVSNTKGVMYSNYHSTQKDIILLFYIQSLLKMKTLLCFGTLER